MANGNAGNTGAIAGLIVDDGGNAGPDFSNGTSDGGSTFNGTLIVDPANVGSGNGDNGSDGNSTGSGPKRRGRKPGSTTTPRAGKAPSLDISGVESILLSAHAMLAGITGVKELAIEKAEANQLAVGIANVSRHYDVQTSQKTLDYINLFMALGAVYGTRLYVLRAKRTAAKKEARDNDPNVISIPGVASWNGLGVVQ